MSKKSRTFARFFEKDIAVFGKTSVVFRNKFEK